MTMTSRDKVISGILWFIIALFFTFGAVGGIVFLIRELMS